MTHGHVLRGRNAAGSGGVGWRGGKGRKKWDNCNSISNKIKKQNQGKTAVQKESKKSPESKLSHEDCDLNDREFKTAVMK